MIQKLRKLLHLESYEESLRDFALVLEQSEFLKSEIDLMAREYFSSSKELDRWLSTEKEQEVIELIKSQQNSLTSRYLLYLGDKKKEYDKLEENKKSFIKKYPHFEKALQDLKRNDFIQKTLDSYRENQLSLDECTTIIKAITKAKVKYSDNIVFNQKGEILIVQRSPLDANGPNLWVLPGGHLNEGEEHEIAAKRELLEETGYETEDVYQVGEYDDDKCHIEYFCSMIDTDEQSPTADANETRYTEFIPVKDLYNYPTMYNIWDNVYKILGIEENVVKIKKAISEGFVKSEKANEESDKRIDEAMHHKDELGAGAEKRKKLKPKEKFHTVMKEWKAGTLHSGGSGDIVTDRKQAIAIAMSESGQSKEKAVENEFEKAKAGIYENTEENRKLGRVGQKYGEKKKDDFKMNITPILIKKDYDLSKDTENDAIYDIQTGLGFKLGRDYAKKGDIIIRVKNHTPEWAYFRDDIEDFGAKAVVNITVGDYDNKDFRKNKTSLFEMQKEFPDVQFIDLIVKDKDSINDSIKRISKEINELHINNELEKSQKDTIPGGKADHLTLEQIAKKHKIDIEDLVKEYKMGLKVEREHTDSEEKAGEIAKDHLTEMADYYTKLAKMESGSKEIKKAVEETDFTDAQKEKIQKFISEYKGDFEDDDIHKFADGLLLDKHEVEEYIYSLAQKGLKKSEESEFEKGYKYIRKEPDGKGGWNYIYSEENKEHISENNKYFLNRLSQAKEKVKKAEAEYNYERVQYDLEIFYDSIVYPEIQWEKEAVASKIMKEGDKKFGKQVFSKYNRGVYGLNRDDIDKVISDLSRLRQTVEDIDDDIPDFKKQVEKDLKEKLKEYFYWQNEYRTLVEREPARKEPFEELWKKAEPEKHEEIKVEEKKKKELDNFLHSKKFYDIEFHTNQDREYNGKKVSPWDTKGSERGMTKDDMASIAFDSEELKSIINIESSNSLKDICDKLKKNKINNVEIVKSGIVYKMIPIKE
jgi:8-oxo-dGTP pyrophosphatase MutT (NUDIX family)